MRHISWGLGRVVEITQTVHSMYFLFAGAGLTMTVVRGL